MILFFVINIIPGLFGLYGERYLRSLPVLFHLFSDSQVLIGQITRNCINALLLAGLLLLLLKSLTGRSGHAKD